MDSFGGVKVTLCVTQNAGLELWWWIHRECQQEALGTLGTRDTRVTGWWLIRNLRVWREAVTRRKPLTHPWSEGGGSNRLLWAPRFRWLRQPCRFDPGNRCPPGVLPRRHWYSEPRRWPPKGAVCLQQPRSSWGLSTACHVGASLEN